ncbi:MAG: sigma 54-interacting transcriptional regulator [Planctomycetota bacterium]
MNKRSEPLLPDWSATILDSIADGVFTVDQDFRVTFFNQAAEEITGIAKSEALGRPCCEVFRADICENLCALKATSKTGKPVVNLAVNILRADGKRLPISISTALLKDAAGEVIGGVETFRDISLVEALRKELTASYSFADIISSSYKMRKIFTILPEIARSESTVLITGKSGTGKELMARAIHSLSMRKDKPFVAVNCGALPDSLLESELFGHMKGAFTGAVHDRPGRFQQAEGGTIFLDEIGDVSPALQVRLLRVLQEREFEPVGSSSSTKADVRVVCATNRDVEALVQEEKFRQDLYYRVNVVRISLPSLNERKEDIPLLVEHFISRLNRLRNRNVTGVTPEVMAVFMAHDWPGNARELENAIEHAFILCRNELIDLYSLPDNLQPKDPEAPPAGLTLAEIEARTIYEALKRNNGRRLATAKELGIDKSTLWRKLQKLNIQLPEEE